MVRMYEGPYRYTSTVLSDSGRVLICPLCPNDADSLAWHLRSLRLATAHQRFHGFRRELLPTELVRMANPDFVLTPAMLRHCAGLAGVRAKLRPRCFTWPIAHLECGTGSLGNRPTSAPRRRRPATRKSGEKGAGGWAYADGRRSAREQPRRVAFPVPAGLPFWRPSGLRRLSFLCFLN